MRCESLRHHDQVPHLILAPFVIAVLYIFGLCYICCLACGDVGLGAFLEVLDFVCIVTLVVVVPRSLAAHRIPFWDMGQALYLETIFVSLGVGESSRESMRVKHLHFDSVGLGGGD